MDDSSPNKTSTRVAFGQQPNASDARPGAELQRLEQARHALDRAANADIPAARLEVQAAAEAARDAGCGWTQIGDVLGIARGNAYQRYRKRGYLRAG